MQETSNGTRPSPLLSTMLDSIFVETFLSCLCLYSHSVSANVGVVVFTSTASMFAGDVLA
jgi:hypothetical protein